MDHLLIAIAASALVTAFVTYVLVTQSHAKKIAGSQAGDDIVLDLRLEQNFQKGKEAGRLEELAKFMLTYEPFAETAEEYMGLKKRTTLGYDMQIHYSGFPIGHKTRYITHQSIEFDAKKIDLLLNNEVTSTISGVVNLIASKGLAAKKLPSRFKSQ